MPENVWIEGSLRPEYGKSGFENENSLLAEWEEKRREIPGTGHCPMGPTKTRECNGAIW